MSFLPRYEIVVSPSDLNRLKRNVWAEKLVPARLDTGTGQQAVGLKYRGAHTRLLDKKSFYIKWHDQEWHLNADAVDPSHIRSKWSFDWFSALCVLAPRSSHVSLTINGKEQGVYTLLESVDKHFLARRRLPRGDLYYAVDSRAHFGLSSSYANRKSPKKNLSEGYELKERVSQTAKHQLQRFIWLLNTLPDDRLATWLQQTVEVHHYLRWLAGAVLTGNADGFMHNYALYRHPHSLKWWIIPWDYDGTWGRDCYGRIMSASEIPLFGYNRLTERILSVPHFRRYYIKLMTHLLNHYFQKRRLIDEAASLMAKVRQTLYATACRRSDIERFEAEQAIFEWYVTKRRDFLQQELKRWQNRI